MFHDRVDAGKKLAEALLALRNQPAPDVVLAIPRGGVIVAHEVARAFNIPLDVCLTHKLGAPGNPELAIGALADDGTLVFDDLVLSSLSLPATYIDAERQRWQQELARRAEVYRGGRARAPVQGKVVIVVDDGVATGSTLIAALRSTRTAGARSLTAAIPVGPRDTVRGALTRAADRVVCLQSPSMFYAVGAFYRNFSQVSDEEVIAALAEP
jgi:predicted phosphoribosyltransferase